MRLTGPVAIQDEEFSTLRENADVNAIAAPVWGRQDRLAAILGIQGPASRLEDPVRLLPVLRGEAGKLTNALGGG